MPRHVHLWIGGRTQYCPCGASRVVTRDRKGRLRVTEYSRPRQAGFLEVPYVASLESSIPEAWKMNKRGRRRKQKSKEKCEICGRIAELKKSWVWLTSYGVRKRVQRMMCKTCIRLEKQGKL